jgi:SagB-type dehydrogenase family enzyme
MRLKTLALAAIILPLALSTARAQELQVVKLPPPHMQGGKPLMQTLNERQSARSFSDKKLPMELISDLLWAAAGINRPSSGKRTAPSARNWQEVDVYAIMQEGAYLYEAKENSLKPVAAGDLRRLAGTQDFVDTAPLNLVFVANVIRMKGASPDDLQLYMGADTGFMAENVYLACASEELAVVVRASVERDSLAAALRLTPQQKIVLAQTVGYPGEVKQAP